MKSSWRLFVGSWVWAVAGMYALGRLEWLWTHPPSRFYTGFAAQLEAQLLPPIVALAESLFAAYVVRSASPMKAWHAAVMSVVFLAWMAQIAMEPAMFAVLLWLVSHVENNYSNWIPGLWAGVYLAIGWQRWRRRDARR